MNALPIALLGVAAFFVYRYYQQPSTIGTPDGAAVPTGGGGGSSTGNTVGGGTSTGGAGGTSNGSGSGGSASSSAPPPPSTQQLSQAQILQGASVGIPEHVVAADQRGWRLNVDQWNWYREQAGADAIDPGFMPALIGDQDRSTPITASEYRRRLTSNGLGYLISSDLWRFQ